MPRQLIEIESGLFVQPSKVTAVKASPLEDESCTVFLSGQSSQDGFVVSRDAEDVIDEINDALDSESD